MAAKTPVIRKRYQVLSKAAGKFIDALQQCCEFQSSEEKNGG